MSNLRSGLHGVFQQNPGNEHEEEAITEFDHIEDPFATVSKTYRQDSVIKKPFNFVESEEVRVGYVACFRKKREQKGFYQPNTSVIYVIKSLEQLPSHSKVLAVIDEGPKTEMDTCMTLLMENL